MAAATQFTLAPSKNNNDMDKTKIFSVTVFVTVLIAFLAWAFLGPMVSGWLSPSSTTETKA